MPRARLQDWWPDTHAYTHDGQRQVPRDRPDIRAHLTGSFTYVAQRFTREPSIGLVTRHGISSPGCQDHDPAAIVPRPPPSDPRPTGRGARLLSRLRRRSRRWLSDIAGLPIGAVDRNGGLTRCRRWRTCWTRFRSGGTTCPATARGATAEALDVVLELRGHVEDLQAVELPKGFGRD